MSNTKLFSVFSFVMVSLFAISLFTLAGSVNAATTWYVDASATGTPDGTLANPYSTIQSAITAPGTLDGDTINVAAGTYTEVGQIVIDKSLSIIGADKATTIIKPNGNIGLANDNAVDSDAWFLVNSGKTFNISNLTLDGLGKDVREAIRYNGNGVVNNLAIENIKYTASYYGTAIDVHSAGTVDITNTQFNQIGRVGVLFKNAAVSTISGNTYTGKGSGDWLDYAFEVQYGARVTMDNNIISNNKGKALSDGSDSSGISVWDDAGATVVTNNNLSNNHIGVAVAFGGYGVSSTDPVVSMGSGNTFTNNDIAVDIESVGGALGSPTVSVSNSIFDGNITAIIVPDGMTASNVTVHNSKFLNVATSTANYGLGALDASNNWWGTSVRSAIEAKLLGSNMTFVPYFITDAMDILSTTPDAVTGAVTSNSTTPSVVIASSTQAVTVSIESGTVDPKIDVSSLVSGGTGTLPALSINAVTSISADPVRVEIPSGTVVSSAPSDNWNGVINAPTIRDNSSVTVPVDSNQTSSVSSAVEVGYGDVKLVFDKAVRILIPGQAGKQVGYSRGGVFTKITTVCSSDTQTDGDLLPAEGDCAINATNGVDLIVWTKHFTTFATYSVTTNQAPAPVSTSRSSGRSSVRVASALTAPVTVSAPAGRVLGASTYRFSGSLSRGATSNAVTELQNRLKAEGFFSGEATGYFGPITFASVRAYQVSKGLPSTGFVGPLTLAKLNEDNSKAESPKDNMSVKDFINLLIATGVIPQDKVEAARIWAASSN